MRAVRGLILHERLRDACNRTGDDVILVPAASEFAVDDLDDVGDGARLADVARRLERCLDVLDAGEHIRPLEILRFDLRNLGARKQCFEAGNRVVIAGFKEGVVDGRDQVAVPAAEIVDRRVDHRLQRCAESRIELGDQIAGCRHEREPRRFRIVFENHGRIVGAGEMVVEYPVRDAYRVAGLEPAYRVVVDLDLVDAGGAERDHGHGSRRDELAAADGEAPGDAEAARERRIDRFDGRRPRELLERCGLHAYDVGRDQDDRQHECEHDAERDESTEYLHRRDGRQQERQEAGRRGERRVQHRCEQVVDDPGDRLPRRHARVVPIREFREGDDLIVGIPTKNRV